MASSDLSRARETAEIVASVCGVPFAYADPDLRERGFGVFEGLTRVECAERYPVEWQAYSEDARNVPPRAESHDGLSARVVAAVTRAALLRPGETALLVTHGGTLRALVSAATGARVPPIANAAVYQVRLDGRRLVGAQLVEPEHAERE